MKDKTSGQDELAGEASKLVRPAKYSFGVEPNKKEDFLAALTQMAEWQTAWFRAIALAWKEDGLKKELLADARGFFSKYCGYTLPEHLDLSIWEDEEQKFNPGRSPKDPWEWSLNKTRLIMYFPPKPEDETMAPVALAAYEAIGKTYPFTTCIC